MNQAPAPLFRDPIYDGAADPTLIWNRQEKSWWLLYTRRRANVECLGVGWCHGTDIGIASSSDQGQTWRYRGTLNRLEFERGRNTFWAPEILWHAGTYHMYVSYVRGVPHDWSGTRSIVHMTSQNLWDWQFESILPLSSDRVIDAGVMRLADNHWRMWYKDEANHSFTYAAESHDLYHWTVQGAVITDCPHEGPKVFFWQGRYWMVADIWNGLAVYHSKDAETWERQINNILATGGQRTDDGTIGGHAAVEVQGDRAFIFYFTHPDWDRTRTYAVHETQPYAVKRTSIQVAELEIQDGILTCDRNRMFDFTLKSGEG